MALSPTPESDWHETGLIPKAVRGDSAAGFITTAAHPGE